MREIFKIHNIHLEKGRKEVLDKTLKFVGQYYPHIPKSSIQNVLCRAGFNKSDVKTLAQEGCKFLIVGIEDDGSLNYARE